MAITRQQLPSTYTELQTCFDSFAIQPTAGKSIADPCLLDQMEYTSEHQQPQPIARVSSNNKSFHNKTIHKNNTTNNPNNSRNNHNNLTTISGHPGLQNPFVAANINQHYTHHRSYVSGYHHQHISQDYEPVINFVDSPPNSEESWADDQSKGSPGPHIIEVQTLYCSSNGTRKRRMDWDSLDIGQGGNPQASAQSVEIASKDPHISGNSNDDHNHNLQHNEKEKHKKEKLSGRGSWTDDIDFDLNAEFNSNSYLNNESFLSFSTALTVLKQEPQTEHVKESKSLSGCVPKADKSVGDVANNAVQKHGHGHGLNESTRGCCSPPPGSEAGPRGADKCGAHSMAHDSLDVFNAEKMNSRVSPLGRSPLVENAGGGTALSDDHKFQYILAAATSIATKNNEETLTYLNQGQSYEIKLKKTGDLSFYRDKILKSVIKICFHERRLQYMEREQMQQWQASRPGERIIEVDVPLSYGLCHVSQPLISSCLNTVEVFWDPLKEVGVYIKVNCISTEFTPKKHGGEKGVPFRLQIETYIESTNAAGGSTGVVTPPAPPPPPPPLPPCTGGGSTGNLTPTSNSSVSNQLAPSKLAPVHAAACQVKVFKLKGADRKHKQDREKIQRRPQSEQGKFQPSYECTIMNDMPLEMIVPSPGCFSPEYMKVWPNSPLHVPKYDGILPYANTSPASNPSPIAINSVTSSNSPTLKLMDSSSLVSPPQTAAAADADDYATNIMPDATPAQVTQWLTHHRLTAYLSTFAHFSGADIMRMSKEDLIQICGLADGIRMFNILRAKAITPRLTIYVSMNGSTSYNAIYLLANTAKELVQKLHKLPGFYELIANSANLNGSASMESSALYNNWGMHTKYSGSGSNIFSDVYKSAIYVSGPSGVHINITDEVLNNDIKDCSLYALEMQSGKVIMKAVSKSEN